MFGGNKPTGFGTPFGASTGMTQVLVVFSVLIVTGFFHINLTVRIITDMCFV